VDDADVVGVEVADRREVARVQRFEDAPDDGLELRRRFYVRIRSRQDRAFNHVGRRRGTEALVL
jgi:hypothetical protein